MKKSIRVIIVMALIAAMVVGMGVVAMAANVEAVDPAFTFGPLPQAKYCDVKLVTTDRVYVVSVYERAPELFEKYSVEAIAEAVAYDRFVNGFNNYNECYNNPTTLQGVKGYDICFLVNNPDLVVLPMCVVPDEDGIARMYLIPIGYGTDKNPKAIGETLTVKYGPEGEEGWEATVTIEEPGRGVLEIGPDKLAGAEDGDPWFFEIVGKNGAGKEIKNSGMHPFYSEIPEYQRVENGSQGGNGGNGGNKDPKDDPDPTKPDPKPGYIWGVPTHGVTIGVGGKQYGVAAAPGLFDEVWIPIIGADDANDGIHVNVWADPFTGPKDGGVGERAGTIEVPLSPKALQEIIDSIWG